METAAPHAGQDWRDCRVFVADFSVTTNALGTPVTPHKAAIECLTHEAGHYPAADYEPAKDRLTKFMLGPSAPPSALSCLHSRLLVGNGASELIDLLIRFAEPNCSVCPSPTVLQRRATAGAGVNASSGAATGGIDTPPDSSAQACPNPKAHCWRPGPNVLTQYMEYERSAKAVGRHSRSNPMDATVGLWCIVNPCNPTGEHIPAAELRSLISSATQPGAVVLVDESMLVWHGPDWRSQSLTSDAEWLKEMSVKRNVNVFIITSWTKIWSCPGLRIGSAVAPTTEVCRIAKRLQVPWSVNGPALAFLAAATEDYDYLKETWEKTREWRRYAKEQIEAVKPHWRVMGVEWMSFLWIDTQDQEEAAAAVSACLAAGVPLRWALHGYDLPSYIRIAVREPKQTDVVVDAIKGSSK